MWVRVAPKKDAREKDLGHLRMAVPLHYRGPLMKTLKIIGIASVLSLGLAACGGGGAVGDMKKFADEMCACKTKECADAVEKKMDAAMEKMTKEPSESEMKEMLGHVARGAECVAKLGGGAPAGETK